MKLTSFLRHFAHMCMVATACMSISACSSNDPTTEPTPKPKPEDNGEVTFTIDLPQGSGNGSSSSPAVVEKGETLDMAISQKSSYTDPDGTVFTCEPKATIKLFAKLDTVVAKDLKELTKVKEGSDIKTDKTGTSPVLNQTVQTFDVGGQNIVFDLSHEIYTYITSTKDKIEMPYIKLNQARFGSTGTTEEKPQGRSAAIVTGVIVRPLAMTRGTILRDSAMYEVNVRFSLDLESVNAKQETKQTLEFSVNYVGIVETVTELPDPIGEVSYKWDIKSGTTSTASPFVKTKEKTPMEIWMAQSCSYTDEYGSKATGEPKAKIKLSVARDTVWTKTLDELKKFAAKDGGTSSEQAATQKFGSDLQDVEIEWNYEVGEAVLADKTIPMPFYTLAPVTLKEVSVTEASNKITVAGKPIDTYEVTATFSQKAAAKNVTTETPEVEAEYVVSYIGVVGETIGEPSAEISYTWDIKSGTESTASPFVKTKGKTPMEIWMAQSCSYADGKGSQATGEPKAKIKLSVARDTVWTKTLDELKKFAAKDGGSSSEQAATQKFGSDLQDVEIEWSYEVGEAVLADKTIPMPFYTLAPVTLKEVSVTEASNKITVAGKPIDTYEVTATFSQKAAAKNVTTETPEVEIEYVVSYIGVVGETIGEPSAEISYTWDIKSGTESTASPFVKAKGKTPMEIRMAQSCSYADGKGSQATGEPKAKIKLSVAQDTVWAKTQDELKKFVAKEGGTSSEQAATQKFGSGLQDVEIEWSYEAGSAVLGGKTVSLPYYALAPVTLKEVSVKEVSDGETVAGKVATVYEVTATFSQKAVAKNVENVSAETPEVEIEYVVSYIGAVELTLVKVEYIPGGEWVDPHDNMVLAYHAKVERYRTYSNGKRVGPDEFYDYGHPVYLVTSEAQPGTEKIGDETVTVFSPNIRTVGDSIKVYTRSIQFSSTKGEFGLELARDEYTSEEKFTDYNWEAYSLSAPENDSRNLAKDFDNPEYPKDDRPSGWYYCWFSYSKDYYEQWPINATEEVSIAILRGLFEFYDQFLVIDGRRIDFKSLHKLDINYSPSEEKLSTADKEGKIVKLEMRASYLGKKFLLTRIDSLYVAK